MIFHHMYLRDITKAKNSKINKDETNKSTEFKHYITMLFHKASAAALCPFSLKWKQSGAK